MSLRPADAADDADDPRSFRVHAGPVEIAGLAHGSPDAPPVVLLHGIRDLAFSMEPLARALGRDFHTLALDLRGHGDSDKPGVYTMSHFVADLRAVVEQQGLAHPVLIGHSLGGHVVSQYAAVFGDTAACVLIEGLGPPAGEGEGTAQGRRLMARAMIERLAAVRHEPKPLADLEDAVARVRRNHPRLDPERARFLAERGSEPHPAGGLRWKWDPAVEGTWSTHSHEQTEERWGWIECPVLVVTGGRSSEWWSRMRPNAPPGRTAGSFAPDEIERRMACFQRGRRVDFPDAGHMVHFDEPAGLAAEIARFLAEVL